MTKLYSNIPTFIVLAFSGLFIFLSLPKAALAVDVVGEGYGWARTSVAVSAGNKVIYKVFDSVTGAALSPDSLSISVIEVPTGTLLASSNCSSACPSTTTTSTFGNTPVGRSVGVYSQVSKAGYHTSLNPGYWTPHSYLDNARTYNVYLTNSTLSYQYKSVFPVNGSWYNFDPTYSVNGNPSFATTGWSPTATSVNIKIFGFDLGPFTAPFPHASTNIAAQGLTDGTWGNSGITSDNSGGEMGGQSGTPLNASTFGIDRVAPTVSCTTTTPVVAPNININVTASDSLSGVGAGDLQVSSNAGVTWTSISSAISGTFSFAGVGGTSYIFRYRARDNTFNTSGGNTQWSAYVSCGASIALLAPPTGLTSTSPVPCAMLNASPPWDYSGASGARKMTFNWDSTVGATSYEVRVTNYIPGALGNTVNGGWATTTVTSTSVDTASNSVSSPPKWAASTVTGSKTITVNNVEDLLVGTHTAGANGFGGSQYGEVHFILSSAAGNVHSWRVIAKNSAGETFTNGAQFTVPRCTTPQNLRVVLSSCDTSVHPEVAYGTNYASTYGSVPAGTLTDAQIQAPMSKVIKFYWDDPLPAGTGSYKIFLEGYAYTSFGSPGLAYAATLNPIVGNGGTMSNDGATNWWGANSDGTPRNFPGLTGNTPFGSTLQLSSGVPDFQWSVNGVAGPAFNMVDCPHHDLHAITIPAPTLYKQDCTTPTSIYSLSVNTLCTKIRVTNNSPVSGYDSEKAPYNTKIGIWPQGITALYCNTTTGGYHGPFLSNIDAQQAALPATQASAGSAFYKTLEGSPLINPVTGIPTGPVVDVANGLPAGATAEVTVTFTVPNWTDVFTGSIIFDPGCTNNTEEEPVSIYLWTNNPYHWVDNTVPISYSVNIDGFFDANGGDVGAGTGTILVHQLTPASGPQPVSDYLLAAGGSLDGSVTSPWRISGYNPRSLVPAGGVYSYMNSKFAAAKAAASCPPSTGPFAANFNHCTGSVTIDSTNYAAFPTGLAVVFIDGDLTINSNYGNHSASDDKSVVFIVGGSVFVKGGGTGAVTDIDGIYIVNNIVTSAFNSGKGLGTLNVYGGVYAGSLVLGRTSSAPLTVPAEVFNTYIKNIILFNSLLGSNSTVWQEVSP